VLLTTVRHLGAIIERTERNAQFVRSNAELQAANQELEAFTYSVSHDLRTPVRHVEGFSTLARRELARGDLTRTERHLSVVVEAAKRMDTLLDAMLTLSRAGRAVLNLQAVPLGRLADQAVNDVTLLFPDRAVNWMVEPLPTVEGDATTLQQVMGHFMENAVKYSPEQVQVRVWAEESEQEWMILVQDQGVGFDPLYAGKLFGAFQRLHSQQEFPGSGIGLATVKRIVTRHGGRVWAESTLGEGATFGFSLPKLRPPASTA
jgi:light-regulated signal transduction histidine kinase (bacteriophytochrome)